MVKYGIDGHRLQRDGSHRETCCRLFGAPNNGGWAEERLYKRRLRKGRDKNVKKHSRKSISLMLAVSMLLSVFTGLPIFQAQAGQTQEVLASWNITANPTEKPDEAEIPADTGVQKSTAVLTTNATGSWGTSPSYFLAANGFDGTPGEKYWQIDLPEAGDCTDLRVSASFRRSSKAALQWKVQSTTDGSIYADVSNGVFSIPTTSGNPQAVTFGNESTQLSLADGTIGIRFMPNDDSSTSSGVCYINHISVTGLTNDESPAPEEDAIIFTPDHEPNAQGYVPAGTRVELSTEEQEDILYTINGDSTEHTYSEPIVINETTTIKAWLSGQEDSSRTVTYKVEKEINTIADARAAGKGKQATLTGIAMHEYASANKSLGLYIQDETGGLMLFGDSALKDAGIKPGDKVQATGRTDEYSGKFELVLSDSNALKIVGSSAVPEPKEVTDLSGTGLDQVGGMLVKVTGAQISKLTSDSYQNANFTLTQDGKTLSAKLDSRRGDDYAKLAAKLKDGDTADVSGILEGYGGSYTLQLLSADGVTNIRTIPVTPKTAKVTANPGSNSNAKAGDKITLSSGTNGARIYYTLNPSAQDTEYLVYSAPIELTSLPASITAYAKADDMDPSEKSVFTYREKFEGEYHVYFGQLHSHTDISDGVGSVETAFDHASQVKNLDFLAVTDHSNYFETADEAKSHTNTILDGSKSEEWQEGRTAAAAITGKKVKNADNPDDPDSGFLGIYGYEMTWSDGSGHINTFNTPGFEDRQNPDFYNKSQSASNPVGLKAYYEALTKVPNSISQFNHPGTQFGDFYDFANYSQTYDKLINLIEVGNGEGPIRGAGYFPSYEYYTRALDKGWHVAPANNQDNHKGNWGDSNTARSVVLAPDLTEGSLYDAMQNCRVYSTEDNDLSIRYTVNGAVMGSEISVDKGEPLNIRAELSDPTDSKIGKVEVIVNGGRVAATRQVESNRDTVEFALPNNYSYYYLRITQADKDIAVTAPVWTGAVDKAGIAAVTADTTLPVKGESVNITANLYNNEDYEMTVTSLEYKVDQKVIRSIGGDGLDKGAAVASLGTNSDTFSYTPQTAGSVTMDVVLKAKLNGVERTFTAVLTLQVADPSAVTKVLVDGTHFNDYVTGYYSQNINNLTKIASDDGTQVRVEKKKITPDMLKDTQLLLISAPAKTSGTSKAGDSYTAQTFGEDFIAMVKEYVQGGGLVAVCGLADYQDGSADPYTSSTQINTLLEGIGAKSAISNDEVLDQENNGGSSYRVYFQNFNSDSPYLKGVDPEQKYSFYSGCSVTPGQGAQKLVNGFDSTYSINSKSSDGKYESGKPVLGASTAYDEATAVKKKGEVCALVSETIGAGTVLVAGTVFFSDFEVKAELDNYGDLQYANYTIVKNLLDSVKVKIKTSAIADVRKNGQMGDVYAVEGTVTAGSEQPNAFTDTVYLQDKTGGINVYPIPNGSGIKVGQKLRVVGHVDAYQGDKELKIGSGVEGYTVLDSAEKPLAPTPVTIADALNYEQYGGRLVKAQGTVSNIKLLSGAVQNFSVTSGGNSIRILINGYISPNVDLSQVVKDGAAVSVVGLVYTDPEGVCLRVRDRNEIRALGNSGGSDNDRDDDDDDDDDPKEKPGKDKSANNQPLENKPIVSVRNDPQGNSIVIVSAKPRSDTRALTAAEIAQKAADGTLNDTVNPNGVWDGKTTGAKNVALVVDTKEVAVVPGSFCRLGVSSFTGPANHTLRVRASRDGFVTITTNPDGTYTISVNKPVNDLYILVEILDGGGTVIGHSSVKLNAAAGLHQKFVGNKAATIV